MKHSYPLIILLFILFSACTPLRVVRMEPPADKIDSYQYGNAVAVQTLGNTEISASFYDATRDVVVFHVEVRNEGKESILYDPADATLTTPEGQTQFAIDPEIELLSYDLEEIKRIRSNRTWGAIGGALAVAGTVAAVTSGDGPDFNGGNDFVGTRQQIFTNLTFSVLDIATAVTFLRNQPAEGTDLPAPDERAFWLDYSMRKTTIKPGEVAFGKLVFPRTAIEGTFYLATPVDNDVAEFEFIQRVYR